MKRLAAKVGIPEDDLSSLDGIVRSVQKEDWGNVLMELGMVQQEILAKVDKEEDRTRGMFIAAGTWLQGTRYASDLILQNMEKVDLSNWLRAAVWVSMLGDEMRKGDPVVLANPVIKAALDTLDQIKPLIDIKRDENIPKDKIQKIFDLATESINTALKVKG
ncbi:MAG: hypothetical protein ABL949_16365 [Fimbriimonadaceae bacterium]